MTEPAETPKPNLAKGIPIGNLADGQILQGKVGDEEAILVRRGAEFFAVGAYCTHYHGPLAEGLATGDTVRCPWHHACFDLRSGQAVRAPALDPISCWKTEVVGETVFVREKVAAPVAKRTPRKAPHSVVIVGGGAAGLAAAEMLRREGYDGSLQILSADDAPPCDRPNLSKDYLAGNAQEDWIPLRPPNFYTDQRIELRLNSRVAALDTQKKQVALENGKTLDFDALLIATGADPVRLEIPGAETAQVHYLRSFADSKAIIARAEKSRQVVVVGASFIGLEVAASLRTRGLEVHVVALDGEPLERVMGPEVGRFVRSVHEDRGVKFHLGETVVRLDGSEVTLKGGTKLAADFLVIGAGVRPALGLAEKAGLAIDKGISVNEYLETSAAGVFAAGDVAHWPDPHTGERIRVEHWVVAERQGQTAARNILGYREPFDAVPFFWSQHYDIAISYTGHAERWDHIAVDGRLEEKNCAVEYQRGGKRLAVATIGRDLENLRAEAAMESGHAGAVRMGSSI